MAQLLLVFTAFIRLPHRGSRAGEIFLSRAPMKEDPSNENKRAALSFECNGCGQFFESWERLRQHEVDCNDNDLDNQL